MMLWQGHYKKEIFHTPLISLPEPKKEGSMRYLVLMCLLMICFLSAGPDGKRWDDDPQTDMYVTTWLSKKKAQQLMRYHGTNGIMVTAAEVYIKRDVHWICVYRDPSVLQEVETRPSVPTAKGEVAAGNS